MRLLYQEKSSPPLKITFPRMEKQITQAKFLSILLVTKRNHIGFYGFSYALRTTICLEALQII
jgi:hypothetical protein